MPIKEKIGPVTLWYEQDERETGELIRSVVEDALKITEEMWGAPQPVDCHVYVMTSWSTFFFQAAPWVWKLLLGVTYPFWAPRAKRTWPYAGAWTQRFGRRVVIGVKTPHALERSDKSAGMHMFIEENDPAVKIRHLTCHELVHACSAHLRLPAWLNEGIAVLTVERYLGKQTIHPDTLALLREHEPKTEPLSYRQLSFQSGKTLAYHNVRGYWLTRFLEEQQPGFLRSSFSSPQMLADLHQNMAERLDMKQDIFWQRIDAVLAASFSAA